MTTLIGADDQDGANLEATDEDEEPNLTPVKKKQPKGSTKKRKRKDADQHDATITSPIRKFIFLHINIYKISYIFQKNHQKDLVFFFLLYLFGGFFGKYS